MKSEIIFRITKYYSSLWTEDEMVEWHHWLSGYEFEQTLGGNERRVTKSWTWLSNWIATAALCVCSAAQLCSTLCDPTDCSLLGPSDPGIFQIRILEKVAIAYSRESSWPRNWTCITCCLLHWQVDSLPLCYLGSPHNILDLSKSKE